MLDEVALRSVLRTQLFTVSGLPNKKTRIAYENRQFKTPEIKAGARKLPLWIKERLSIFDETRSSQCFMESVGLIIWSVKTPEGRGTEQADALALKIAKVFQPGTHLVGDDITVLCEHTERRPFRPDPVHENWISKPVTVRWRVFTPLTSS